MIRLFFTLCAVLFLTACSTIYPNQQIVGQSFPTISGESLEKQTVALPDLFSGKPVVLLLGYKQNGQFDIDRWLIGMDMTKTAVEVYELPAIQGWLPRQIKGTINEGMRKGIPDYLWRIVITVYEDGDKLQQFTGNENGNNARVILLDQSGTVQYFHDKGFSVQALNELRMDLNRIQATNI